MHQIVSLTVSESKRLIARGIARDKDVKRAFHEGMLCIAPGTTNAYVIEELTGEPIDKCQYVTGRTLPSGYDGNQPGKKMSDVVYKNGEKIEASIGEAVEEMKAGDVILKGANALNHELGQAGLLIGHPKGGTLASVIGFAMARRIHLIHPVGLEKSIPGNLYDIIPLQKELNGTGPTLWPSPGEPFTEIEALAVLADCAAFPVASGGIGGAEGAIWLMLTGNAESVERGVNIVEDVHGEPPFLTNA